ncbi:MAG: PTS system mannose/fructose/sorbose family transporter subunit IID [Elusimicrobiaceae bacterium]|nr:PTS system mannose/fructose/sorbose family transporter subunit IID [Elusimicrobiaceae bacterium]
MNFTMHLRLFLRSLFIQTGWNFTKYQNIGLAFTMYPFLRRIYQHDPEALPSVVDRYLENFNTQPMMASFCLGALARQEERLAQTKTLAAYKERLSEWNGIKRSLSITSASIGDRLFWGTLKPFTLLLALCIWLLVGINFFEIEIPGTFTRWELFGAAAAAFLAFNAIALFVKWQGITLSYHAVNNGCFGLTKFDWNKTIYNAKRIGILISVVLLLWGVYYFVHDLEEFLGVQFITRAVLVLFFVSISLMTRDLRIPNMYVYIAAMLAFSLVSLF